MHAAKARRGLTLMELVVVLGILTILGSMVVINSSTSESNAADRSRETATRVTLTNLRDTIVNSYVPDQWDTLPRPATTARIDHPQLVYLLVNPLSYELSATTADDVTWSYDPVSQRGWRGPYLVPGMTTEYQIDAAAGFTNRYGEAGDATFLDGWGRPVVLQEPQVSGLSAYNAMRQARLVSAGPNGVIDTDPDVLIGSIYPDPLNDDIILGLWSTP